MSGGLDFTNERPIYSIRPPAITRHLVFRMRKEQNPRFAPDKDVNATWNELCDVLSAHVNSIRASYDCKGPTVRIVPPHTLCTPNEGVYSAARTALIELRHKYREDYRLRVRVDIYTEIFTLTYLIDRIKGDSRSNLAAAFNNIYSTLPTPADHDETLSKCSLEYITGSWWTEEAEFLASIDQEKFTRSLQSCDRKGAQLIADFRGAVITPTSTFELSEIPYSGERSNKLLQILEDSIKNRISLIRHLIGKSTDDTGGEAVLCGMVGGNALYAARLGQHAMGPGLVAPIRHLIVYAGSSRRQLGRLVRRLHVLGELRHEALLDWDISDTGGLRSASRLLHNLGSLLDGSKGEGIDRLPEAVSQLNAISRVAIEGGGLHYRVEQSRYYAKAFENTLRDVREIKVGDWQTYSEFINRYIVQLFSRIDRIGRRFEAAGRRVDRLLYYEQVLSLRSYQSSVGNSLVQLHKSTDHLDKTSEKQRNLLENAEVFALLFAVYYVGSIAKEAIDHHLTYNKSSQIPLMKSMFLLLWLFAAALFSGKLLVRFSKINWNLAFSALAPRGRRITIAAKADTARPLDTREARASDGLEKSPEIS